MNETKETDSGAGALPYRIEKRYIGSLSDCVRTEYLEEYCRMMHCDIALELRGINLEAFAIRVYDVPNITYASRDYRCVMQLRSN